MKGHKLELIKANPAACALIFEDDGYVDGKCEHKYRSLVVRGDIVVADTLDEKKHGIDILIRHQESDPRTVRSRNLTNDADYDIFNILRLDIDDITAKESV